MASTADSLAARFDTHQFVFIGSTHGDLKIERFLTCLVSRPAFTQRATDIVVEWASSGHQRLLDRYVLALDPIPDDSLAPIWLDTDSPTLWTTLPQLREFLHVLRDVNRTLPSASRIRLIGGNEGIDWTKVRVVEDLAPYPYKTNLVPHLLTEHLAKAPRNRTLVIYGDCHIHYGARNFMVDLADALGRNRLFISGRIGELVPAEHAFLARLGDPQRPFFAAADRVPPNIEAPGSLRVCGEQPGRPLDFVDGFVYLGPDPDRNMVGTLPLTVGQRQELARRSSIMSNGQQTMRTRASGKAQWFSAHPSDFPSRPPL